MIRQRQAIEEFFVGQDVVLSEEGRRAFKKVDPRAVGKVRIIREEPYAFGRKFSMSVKFPGFATNTVHNGNGAYFKPVAANDSPAPVAVVEQPVRDLFSSLWKKITALR